MSAGSSDGLIPQFRKYLKEMFDTSRDPAKHCDLYKDKAAGSCCHVDGLLCDFPKCDMLRKYKEKRALLVEKE